MSVKTNKNKELRKNDSSLFKFEDLKISEVSTTDIKIEEIDAKIKSKNDLNVKNKSKPKKKVTFYPLIILEEIESYKQYNREILRKRFNQTPVCTCGCNTF